MHYWDTSTLATLYVGLRLHRLNPPLVVRTLDGIHIAKADLRGADALVATDSNMRKCAAAIGLKVYP